MWTTEPNSVGCPPCPRDQLPVFAAGAGLLDDLDELDLLDDALEPFVVEPEDDVPLSLDLLVEGAVSFAAGFASFAGVPESDLSVPESLPVPESEPAALDRESVR